MLSLLGCIITLRGFPGGSDGKEFACNAWDPGLIPGWGRSPGERNGYPFQYFCLENPQGHKRLAGYSPWVTKSWTQLNNLHLQEISCPPGNKIKKTLCCYKLTFFFLSQREILFTAHEFTKYLRQKISKRSSLSTDKSWKQTPTGQCDTEVKKWFDTYLNYFIKMYLNTP